MQPREERFLFKHILEGLIHNVNNPLNLVLGYAQQLMKKYPHEASIEKLFKAAGNIDDIMGSTYTAFCSGTMLSPIETDLSQWVNNTLVLLRNDLDIKRNVSFTLKGFDHPCPVLIIPVLLQTLMEAVIYDIRFHALDLSQTLTIELWERCGAFVQMLFSCPTYDFTQASLEGFCSLQELFNRKNASSGMELVLNTQTKPTSLIVRIQRI